MIRISCYRSLKALLLLLLMVINFSAEGLALYRVYGGLLSPHGDSVCAGSSSCCSTADSAEAESCCSAVKEESACGCSCCGNSCPMGNACTCGADGEPASQPEGLFFRVPGCHTGLATDANHYLPLSMRLVYLAPDVCVQPYADVLISLSHGESCRAAGLIPAPPVPPPRSSAA